MLQDLTALKKCICRVLLKTEVLILQMGEGTEEAEWLLVPAAEAEQFGEFGLSFTSLKQRCGFL